MARARSQQNVLIEKHSLEEVRLGKVSVFYLPAKKLLIVRPKKPSFLVLKPLAILM